MTFMLNVPSDLSIGFYLHFARRKLRNCAVMLMIFDRLISQNHFINVLCCES